MICPDCKCHHTSDEGCSGWIIKRKTLPYALCNSGKFAHVGFSDNLRYFDSYTKAEEHISSLNNPDNYTVAPA